jgi:hypothetical protein
MILPHANFGKYILHFITLPAMGVILSLAILGCSTGSRVSKADPALSLQTLEALCSLPLPCGRPMACRDRSVTLWGYLDPVNIYNKRRFPGMPNEKFRLVDRRQRAIEVWVLAEDSRPIFDKLDQRPTDRIVVSGKLAAFDMPIAGRCHQGIKVMIHDASQIEFK